MGGSASHGFVLVSMTSSACNHGFRGSTPPCCSQSRVPPSVGGSSRSGRSRQGEMSSLRSGPSSVDSCCSQGAVDSGMWRTADYDKRRTGEAT